MNPYALQNIANEETVGREEVFDPSSSIVNPKLTDQEDADFGTSRFWSAKIVAKWGMQWGLAPWQRSCSFINPRACCSSAAQC